MQQKDRKIGWQKYEDYIEKQISSPFLTNIIHTMLKQKLESFEEENLGSENQDADDDDLDNYEDLLEETGDALDPGTMLPLTPQLIEDISLISNFDCWVGHTNFDLTHSIKEALNNVPGVEILKIWSRYRFFIGIGKMFDFAEVRNNIEKTLIKGEEE